LPPDKQHEVCDFAEFLHERSHAGRPLKDPEGIWKGRCADITLDEIKEVRREMWGNFPREVAR
jgi:hypothetical protein